MLTLDQCLGANRPFIFVVAESDLEVLQHIHDNYKDSENHVYSTSLAGLVPLKELVAKQFNISVPSAMSAQDAFQSIAHRKFDKSNTQFVRYIFLDCQSYINDSQTIRNIKDILSQYQLNVNYTVSLIFVSLSVNVPLDLQRLSEVTYFDLPSEAAVRTLVADPKEGIISKFELDKSIEDKAKEEIIMNMRGMTKFEIEMACFQSFYLHKTIDLNFIREFKKSSIAKTDLLTLLESDMTFNDIGGMENLKRWIKKSAGGWTVEGKKFGLPNLKGVLLVGLPGTGKSLLMKSIGQEWGLPVISFDPSRIFSSRVGDSEANMRRVLQIVEGMAPCVLSIDEVEKGLAGIQSSTFSDSGVTARVIGSFLTWMQDCKAPVFTIATANNLQYLPPELISRFDETFFVNMPQSYERQEIFRIHIKRLGRDVEKFDLKILAEKSQDLSGREIEQVLRESMYDAFHAGKDLDTELICNVLSKKTNLLTTSAEQLKYLLKWVGYDEVKKDGVRARFASTPDSTDMSRVQSEIDRLITYIEKGEGK